MFENSQTIGMPLTLEANSTLALLPICVKYLTHPLFNIFQALTLLIIILSTRPSPKVNSSSLSKLNLTFFFLQSMLAPYLLRKFIPKTMFEIGHLKHNQIHQQLSAPQYYRLSQKYSVTYYLITTRHFNTNMINYCRLQATSLHQSMIYKTIYNIQINQSISQNSMKEQLTCHCGQVGLSLCLSHCIHLGLSNISLLFN